MSSRNRSDRKYRKKNPVMRRRRVLKAILAVLIVIFILCVAVVGVLLFGMAVWTMRDSWRAGIPENDKTKMVTKGIYQFSRNPAFLGFDLMYIGILFSFFNWILCVATSFAIVLFNLQIVNVEEDFLIEAFGDEYLQYKKKVRRYLGRKSKL